MRHRRLLHRGYRSEQPWIFYADDVHEDRVRFTILHELGHHLLVTVAAELLDDIDMLGGSADGAIQTEEAVCHRFAGNLLVPDELLAETIGSDRVKPEHVVAIHERGGASWEAVRRPGGRGHAHSWRGGAVARWSDRGVLCGIIPDGLGLVASGQSP